MGVLSGRRRGRLLPPVLVLLAATVSVLALVTVGVSASPGHAPRRDGRVASLQLFYRSPVLVRAGERVQIPVDVVCATVAGTACPATATVAVRDGRTWVRASAPAIPTLRFDVTGRANRAAGATSDGAVRFRVSAHAGDRSVAVPGLEQRSALSYYVTDDMPTVAVPPVAFGDVRQGSVSLYLPWGSGAGQAGLVPGLEADTVGPSSFDVDGAGRILVADPVQQKVSLYSNGRLVRDSRFQIGVRSDVAFASDGGSYVASPPLGGSQAVLVRSLDPSGRPGRVYPVGIADDLPAELRTAGTAAYVRVLPEDEWLPVAGGRGGTTGQPLSDGSELLKVVDGNAVRLGTVVNGQVTRAVELTFQASIGEIALARSDGSGGYWVVVHVSQDQPAPADQFQVVHVRADLSVSTFAVANHDYSDVVPMSRFRLGQDGGLYAMESTPDGIRIVRYDLGGAR
jgi:hypothetical protein